MCINLVQLFTLPRRKKYCSWFDTMDHLKHRKRFLFFILLYQKSGRKCQTNLFFPHCHEIWCAYSTPISIFYKKNSLSGRHLAHSDYTILSCHFFFLAKYQLLPYTFQPNGDCLTESFVAIWICISDNIRASADLCWRCGELNVLILSSVAWIISVREDLP